MHVNNKKRFTIQNVLKKKMCLKCVVNHDQWINIYTKEEIKYSNWSKHFYEKSHHFAYISVSSSSAWWVSTDSPITDEYEKPRNICMDQIHNDSTSELNSGSGSISGESSSSGSDSNSSSSDSSSVSGTTSGSISGSTSGSTSGWSPGSTYNYIFPFPIDFCTEGLHNCHKDANCVTVDHVSKSFECNCVNKMTEFGLIVVGDGVGENGCKYTIESKPQHIYGSDYRPTSGLTSGSTSSSISSSTSSSISGSTSGSNSLSSGHYTAIDDDFIIDFTLNSPFDSVRLQIILIIYCYILYLYTAVLNAIMY